MTTPLGFTVLGVAGLPAVAVAFASRGDVPVGPAILAALLLVTLPALAVAQLELELPDDIDAMSVYVSSGLLVAALALLSLLLGVGTPGPAAMGLGPIAPGAFAIGSALSTAAGLGVLAGGRLVSRRSGWKEADLVRLVMPASRRERRAFVGVSLAAGLGEEIAYRGFLLGLILQVFGDPVTAVVLTSIAFGLLHAYQGVLGMLRTGVIGVLFAAIAIALGSVWPVVVGHVMINLVAGLVLGEWLLDTES